MSTKRENAEFHLYSGRQRSHPVGENQGHLVEMSSPGWKEQVRLETQVAHGSLQAERMEGVKHTHPCLGAVV